MELSNVLLSLNGVILLIIGVLLYIKINQMVFMLGLYVMEPKKTTHSVGKTGRLKYNPADLFNPYKYENDEGQLDPVVPDIINKKDIPKSKKTEY